MLIKSHLSQCAHDRDKSLSLLTLSHVNGRGLSPLLSFISDCLLTHPRKNASWVSQDPSLVITISKLFSNIQLIDCYKLSIALNKLYNTVYTAGTYIRTTIITVYTGTFLIHPGYSLALWSLRPLNFFYRIAPELLSAHPVMSSCNVYKLTYHKQVSIRFLFLRTRMFVSHGDMITL